MRACLARQPFFFFLIMFWPFLHGRYDHIIKCVNFHSIKFDVEHAAVWVDYIKCVNFHSIKFQSVSWYGALQSIKSLLK
jgi:hypothetical protein